MKPTRSLRSAIVAVALLVPVASFAAMAAPSAAQHHAAERLVSRTFSTPEAAAQALVAAIRARDARKIGEVLGRGSDALIRSGDPVADEQARNRFIAAYETQSKIELAGEKATLLVGEREWPFPFPLVKRGDRWSFDATSGATEILNRRIGRNELSAIQVCLAYVDAQREYAAQRARARGAAEYALKFASSPGKRDGLYWPTPDGEPLSPLGRLVVEAHAEGYHAQPYHGYYYRIVTGQGPAAPDGAYDYVVKGKMIGGFALVAYPARWGSSGVMTFIVNHDGIVYQKNLGVRTTAIASKVSRFNPDSTWSKAEQP